MLISVASEKKKQIKISRPEILDQKVILSLGNKWKKQPFGEKSLKRILKKPELMEPKIKKVGFYEKENIDSVDKDGYFYIFLPAKTI